MKPSSVPPVRLFIPLKPVSWNVLVRKHYWTVKKVFDEWREATHHASRGLLPFIPPVAIEFRALWKTKRRHDVDSLIVKPILDQLVLDGFLPDDNTSYVQEVAFTGVTGAACDAFEVTITSV